MELLYAIGAAVLAPYLLWFFYLATMNLQRAALNGTLGRAAYLFGLPLHYTGYLLDVVLNWTLFSVLVFDVPREATITQHMRRLLAEPLTARWRRTICVWICVELLDAFDPDGKHVER